MRLFTSAPVTPAPAPHRRTPITPSPSWITPSQTGPPSPAATPLYNENDASGSVNTSPYAGYDTGQTTVNNNGYLALVHVFSPTLTTSSKLLYTRYNNQQPLGTAPVGPTLYSNSASSQGLGNGTIYFPGYSATTPGSAIPFGGPQNEIQAIEDLTKTAGRHSLRLRRPVPLPAG